VFDGDGSSHGEFERSQRLRNRPVRTECTRRMIIATTCAPRDGTIPIRNMNQLMFGETLNLVSGHKARLTLERVVLKTKSRKARQ
jgi:hypothetical protein